MVVHLPPDIEKAIADKASELGAEPEFLAIETLRKHFSPSESASGKAASNGSLYDRLKDCIGVIDSGEILPGGAQMSQNRREKLTSILLEKQNRRRLP